MFSIYKVPLKNIMEKSNFKSRDYISQRTEHTGRTIEMIYRSGRLHANDRCVESYYLYKNQIIVSIASIICSEDILLKELSSVFHGQIG